MANLPMIPPPVSPAVAPPPREKVLVISSAAWDRQRAAIQANGGASGDCYSASSIDLPSLVASPRFDYRDRVESDESVKQVIPCALLTFDGKVLCYQRQGSEQRCLGKFSVLIGGHINPCDLHSGPDHSPMAIVRRGLGREMEQELGFDPVDRDAGPEWVIGSEDDAVSRVHLALVYRCHLTSSPILSALEGELAGARWLGAEDVVALDLESWSRASLLAAFPDAFEAKNSMPPIGAHAATDDDGGE